MRSMLLASLLLSTSAMAAPGVIPVQGYLTDDAGYPIDGDVSITFRLFANTSATSPFYTDTFTLDAADGRFSVRLGSGSNSLDLADFSAYPEAQMTVQIEGDAQSAKIPLDYVPYAAYAAEASTLQGSDLADILDQVPAQADVESMARGVCFDTEAELTALLDDNYGVSTATNWGDITNRPVGLDDGDDVLSQAQSEAYARGVCYDTEAELTAVLDDNYKPASYAPAWTDITGRPTGLDDGDNNTTYTAGNGLTLASGQFSVNEFANGPMIPNPRFEAGTSASIGTGATQWSVTSNGSTAAAGNASVVTDTLGAAGAGGYAIQNTAATVAWVSSNARVPVRTAQTYQVQGTFRRVDTVANSSGTIYLAVRFFNSSGADIAGGDGNWHYYPVSGVQIGPLDTAQTGPYTDNNWHTFSATFGDNARPIPAGAVTMTVGAILNYYNNGAGNRQFAVTNLQIKPTATGLHQAYWQTGTLANGWITYSAAYNPFGYWKDASGVVHLRGMLKSGTPGNTAIFTLPAGYRPAYRELFDCETAGNTVDCRLDVLANGQIQIVGGDTTWTSIDGISFVAAQ